MPKKIFKYDVIIGVGVNSSGLSKGSKDVEESLSRWERRALKAIKSIEKAMDGLSKVENKIFTDNSAKSGGSSGKWTNEHKAIVKATQLANRYDDQMMRLNKRDSELVKLNRLLAQPGAAQGINETTRAILKQKASIVDNIRETQRLQREQEKAARESRRASSLRSERISTVGGGIQSAGIAATAIATAPIVAGFYAAIKVGAEYERSMNLLQAVTRATAEEMKRADALAIKLGADIKLPGVSAKDAADAMLELGKAGMTVEQSMAAAKGTLQLATAAGITAGQAAEITANALNAFSLQATEAGRVADLLAGAANASSAEITDIALSLQQAGAVFANAKVPIEDVVALIGEMANAGIKGSDAGTSLKTMMQRLQSPTDNAAAAMKALNVQIYDQQGRMKPMRDIIGQFEQGLKGLSQQQKDQALNTIFGADAVRAATIVFNQGAAGFDKMKEAVMRANAAQELSAARTKGLAGAWEALKSQAETVGLIIFNRIKAPLTALVIFVAEVVQKMTDAFVSLPEGMQTAILAFTALAAAIGPVLAVLGTLLVAIASVVEAVAVLGGLGVIIPVIAGVGAVIAGLVAGLSLAAGAVYALFEAWDSGIGPFATIVVGAIGAAIAAFSPILGLPVLIGAALVAVYKIWTTNFAGMRDFIIVVWNKVVEIFNGAMTRVVALVNEIGGKLIGWWRQNLPLMQEISAKITAQIQTTIQRFLAWVTQFWAQHGERIMSVVNTVWGAVKSVITFTVEWLLNAFRFWLQVLNGNWSGAWETFLKVVKNAVRAVVGVWAWLQVASLKFFKWLIGAAWENGKKLTVALVESIASGIKWLVQKFIELPQILMRLVPRLITAGKNIGTAIWNGIKEGLWGNAEKTEDIPSVPFDITKLFDTSEATNPAAAAKAAAKEPNFLDKLADSMKGLGDATRTTTGETTKFNRSLDDMDKKSSKTRSNKASVLAIQDASLPELLAAMRSGTMEQESGGRLNARNKRTGALGLFQVMPENIPEWTRNTPGVGQLTVEQFRANPEAQKKVFDKYMGDYLRRAMQMSGGNKAQAVRMAAAAWYGGPDDFRSYDNGRRFRPDEPSFREYTTKVLSRTQRALRKTRRGDGSFETEKSFDELADESIFNDAKQRVQALITLARELNVALTVSTEVTTTNEALILQQKTELKNLQDLKKKREEIEEAVQRLGLKQADFSRANLEQATASLTRIGAIEEAQTLVNSTFDDSVKKLEEMRAATDGSLTPLEEFNLKFERLQKNSGLSREEFERLNPKLAETRQKLQEIADLDFEQKLSEKLKALGEDISKEVARIQAETAKIGKTDAQKRAIDRQTEIDDYIAANKVPENRRSEVERLFSNKYAALDAQEAAHKAADATALYTDEVRRLNEALTGNVNLTEAQKLEFELTTGKLRDLTDEQKNHLRMLQQSADAQAALNAQYNETYDFIRDTFEILTDSGTSFGDKMKTIFGGIFSSFKKMLLDMATAWIMSKIFPGVQSGNNQQSGGGNWLQAIFGNIFNSGNRSVSNRTPSFNPNPGMPGNGVLSILSGGAASGNSFPTWNVSNLTTNANPVPLGGAMRAISSNLPAGLVSGVAHGVHGAERSGIHEVIHGATLGTAGKFSLSGLGKSLGSLAPMMGLSFGGMMGGNSIGGQILGSGGGLIAGTLLQTLMAGGFTGATATGGIFGSIGGAIGLSGAATAGIALAALPLIMFGSWLLGRNKQRRADEKTRNQAMLDAFSALDKLIADVGADKIDGAQALSQAEDIRTNYLQNMRGLKDGKARRHALADVHRIDAKITILKSAIKSQDQRKEKLQMLTPTFADGGAVSNFARNNFQNNPLGYVQGPGTTRSDSIRAWFPVAGTFADISNREYVLDAETTSNVGVRALDALRASKGKNFDSLMRRMSRVHESRIKLADGGAVGTNLPASSAPAGSVNNFSVSVENKIYPIEGGARVETDISIDTPEGKKKLESKIEEILYEGGPTGKIPTAVNRLNKGQR